MSDAISIEECEKIQMRLREAERIAKQSLESAPADDPLAGATSQLLQVHSEVRQMLRDSLGDHATRSDATDEEILKAEMEIEREAHEANADPKDVLKALFMWRDDPSERVRGGN